MKAIAIAIAALAVVALLLTQGGHGSGGWREPSWFDVPTAVSP